MVNYEKTQIFHHAKKKKKKKHNPFIKKSPLKERKQNPSRYYNNSITNLKFEQNKPK
jgi:hypothetical protein